MRILVTGGAGFIGSHLCEALLARPHTEVICIDNFNDFYDPKIKRQNVALCLSDDRFRLYEMDILDTEGMSALFARHSFDAIIHLAAYAGVRPSIAHPLLYGEVNVMGTIGLLELAKTHGVKKILYASSSSVYGNNTKVPFSEADNVDFPVSPYAATKKAGELLCYNYHYLYNLSVACLRFFTVYGPRQRPEMAIHKFAQLIRDGKPIPVYNHGKCLRDYTYISDIIDGILHILDADFSYDIVNLGESQPISTLDLITLLEGAMRKKARIELLPAQPGDVEKTYADISKAKALYHYRPQFPIARGIVEFVNWFND
jgi:UDP-glucuronate 4-epimerase